MGNFSVYLSAQSTEKELSFKEKENKYLITSKKDQVCYLCNAGEEKLNELVDLALKNKSITEEEHRALIEEIKKEEKQVKNQQSLKDYLKMKKRADDV